VSVGVRYSGFTCDSEGEVHMVGERPSGGLGLFPFLFSLLSCSIIMSIKLGRCGQEACVHVRYGRDIPIPIPVFFPVSVERR